MSQEVFGVVVTAALGVVGWLLLRVFDNRDTVKEMSASILSVDKRVIRIESFIDLVGRNMAAALHSPDTPEFDILAEKYSARFELTRPEWERLRELCIMLHQANGPHPNKHSGYVMLASVCDHKLMLPSWNTK